MSNKRQSPFENKIQASKKKRSDLSPVTPARSAPKKSDLPVYELMKPTDFLDIVGQDHLVGSNGVINNFFQNNDLPSMILCGPHGCGKDSLVNALVHQSKSKFNVHFVKLSATSSGIKDIRLVVSDCREKAKEDIKTIVYIDHMHRFNKLQQDILLPHVEAGTFILIGSTTENPSFGINSALLSRCRIFVLSKLEDFNLSEILLRGITFMKGDVKRKLKSSKSKKEKVNKKQIKFYIQEEAVEWIAKINSGNAKSALEMLENAVQDKFTKGYKDYPITLDDVKKLSKVPNDKSQNSENCLDQMYNALHHSILNSKKDAAVYWLVRIMVAKEDPVCIAKYLVKIASSEIDLEDDCALDTAIHTVEACQLIGMPECDVFLTQCVTYLAEAEKNKHISNLLNNVNNVEEMEEFE